MSISIIDIPIPTKGDGPIVDVSNQIGPKTILMAGTFSGSYVLLASHDDSRFVPILQFDSSADIKQTADHAYKSFRIRTLASPTTAITCSSSAIDGTGQNHFTTVATVAAGSRGLTPILDTTVAFPPSGPEQGINFVCRGSFSGQIVVLGSTDGSNFSPIGTFRTDAVPTDSSAIEFSPIGTLDKTKYVRLFVDGTVLSSTVVTMGGQVTVGGTVGDNTTATVENIASLRALVGGPLPTSLKSAIVKGYYAAADGGGGEFVWTTDTTSSDNTGTIIVPSALPRSGCWKRVWVDEIEAAWFGALGDNTYQTATIQAAVDYAHSLMRVANEYIFMDAMFVLPTVRLASGGKYRISDGASLSLGRLNLCGDQSEIWSSSTTHSLLQIDGAQNKLEGLVLEGGKNHVEFVGGNINGMTTTMSKMYFGSTTGSGPSILMASGYSMNLTIERFKFDGGRFFGGGGAPDKLEIASGWVNWDTSKGSLLTFVGGIVHLRDILGVPSARTPNTWWIDATECSVSATDFRFGGESGGSPMLKWTYSGVVDPGYRTVSFVNCGLSCADAAWINFNGGFPNSFEVIGCYGLAGGDLTGSIVLDAQAIVALYNSSLQNINVSMLSGFPARPIVFRDTNLNLVEQPALLAQLPRFSNNASELPQTNLFVASVYDLSQFTISFNDLFSVTGSDASLGYSLTEYTATKDRSRFIAARANWGAGRSSGTYCFSLKVKTTGLIEIGMTYSNFQTGSVVVGNTQDTYQEIYFPFYHDASAYPNASLGLDLRNVASGVVMEIGLFAVHPGKKPARYLYPQNPTTSKQAENYYGTTPPGSGTYRVGDTFTTDSPSPGNPYMWICTSSSPLTWSVAVTL